MRELINVLPPKYSTWLEFYEDSLSYALKNTVSKEGLNSPDFDSYKLNITDYSSDYVPTDYTCDLWYVKARALEEIHAALPSRRDIYEQTKSLYASHIFATHDTVIMSFLNSLPTKWDR